MSSLMEVFRRHAVHFGPNLAKTAFQRGLAVTHPDGRMQAIPVTATPVVMPTALLERRAALSAILAEAGFKMAHSLLAGEQKEWVFGALSELERRIIENTWRNVQMLATTRVDYFLNEAGEAKALELNATIPAMQGYSDIAATSFIEIVGQHAGLSQKEVDELKRENGSNARALFDALQMGHERKRGRKAESILLLCRRNDAQISEQRYLCEKFREWGVDAEVVFPDELVMGNRISARGKSFDLLYRHLFVRRLEEPGLQGALVAEDIFTRFDSLETVVLNPPVSQAEVKTTFAFLSEATHDEALASTARLTESELWAIRESIPWTRAFRSGRQIDCDGQPCPDLVERVASEPDRFVLKRAWDYGGKAVFVGKTAGQTSFNERVSAAFGKALDWKALCEACATDKRGGGFVVQEIVPTRPETHLLCEGESQREALLYVDFSAYASVGLGQQPRWGGVCRGSASHIVNIVGGGGVLPLLHENVAQKLAGALNPISSRTAPF